MEEIQGKLVYAVPKGQTALLDAIYMGVSKMKDAHNSKKALLIISDGGDNHSRYTENEIKSMVKEADRKFIPSALFNSLAIPRKLRPSVVERDFRSPAEECSHRQPQ